ncbi:uncharacterized protein RSE6_02308 [Rhynchosporium secalis]|uniref:Uncharacterized protein n=1 Tax=Rhynchosporium secalis TaxID=38038 RepID=A0A1E1M1I0_RHYSE|nr:uncharacterized protein RSE6_02308 [Rhynchosporium secalis]
MSASVFNMNNYARATTERYSDVLDSRRSALQHYRTSADFWNTHTDEAMALRNQKFKVYNHQAQRAAASAPSLREHYEDHLIAGSRQPRIPSARVKTQMGYLLQPDPLEIRVPDIPFWVWILVLLILVAWM